LVKEIRGRKGKERELANGARAAEKEGEGDGPRGADGPPGSRAGLAERQKNKVAAQLTYLSICTNKRVGFEIGFDIRFELGFEFDCLSNSNNTQVNSK
jgi:hypothetical protein